MKKFLIALLVILGIAAVTCPDQTTHVNAVQSVINEKLSDYNPSGSLLGGMLTAIGSTATNWLLKNQLTVKNYYVCSIGTIRWKGEDKVVSVGAFGHVFTFSKEDLNRMIREGLGD